MLHLVLVDDRAGQAVDGHLSLRVALLVGEVDAPQRGAVRTAPLQAGGDPERLEVRRRIERTAGNRNELLQVQNRLGGLTDR